MRREAWTLVEILVVLAVIGLIAGLTPAASRSLNARARAAIPSLQEGLDAATSARRALRGRWRFGERIILATILPDGRLIDLVEVSR